MSGRNYFAVSGVLFALVALAHLLRVVLGLTVQVDATPVPMLVSWIGLIVPAALSYWAFALYRGSA